MNLDSIEVTMLRNLVFNEEFLRKVVPFIKPEYFENINQKIIFEEVVNFVEQYNKPVTKEILCIEIEKSYKKIVINKFTLMNCLYSFVCKN